MRQIDSQATADTTNPTEHYWTLVNYPKNPREISLSQWILQSMMNGCDIGEIAEGWSMDVIDVLYWLTGHNADPGSLQQINDLSPELESPDCWESSSSKPVTPRQEQEVSTPQIPSGVVPGKQGVAFLGRDDTLRVMYAKEDEKGFQVLMTHNGMVYAGLVDPQPEVLAKLLKTMASAS